MGIIFQNGFGIGTVPQNGGGGISYTIGQAALGGIVAYIYGGGSTGTSGLVATVSDQSTGIYWGPGSVFIATGASGKTNTPQIKSIYGDLPYNTYAAGLAASITDGGYNDWFLPSQDELNNLYLNRATIGGFTTNTYWSSSAYDNYSAMYQNFNDGNQYYSITTSRFYIRAVRSFGIGGVAITGTKLGNNPVELCPATPITTYTTTGSISTGLVAYTDVTLTTPQTGYFYIANDIDGLIYYLDPSTGLIGSYVTSF